LLIHQQGTTGRGSDPNEGISKKARLLVEKAAKYGQNISDG
jgi:hypothetical protein